MQFLQVSFHLVDVVLNAAPSPEGDVVDEVPFLSLSLLVWPQVEHVHDLLVGIEPLGTEHLLHQHLEALESCRGFQDIGRDTQDIHGKVEHGTAREVTVGVEDEVALGRAAGVHKI